MPFPSVSIAVECDPAFRKRAEYAFRMLGSTTGFAPVFVEAGESAAAHYAFEPPQEGVWIPASREAHAFLAAKNIFDTERLRGASSEGLLTLFPVNDIAGGDFVAATFFFLSLHEEWSSEVRDQFGRFTPEESLLGKLNLLDRPLVAEYAAHLAEVLEAAGHAVKRGGRFGAQSAAVAVSHDIDYITKATPGLAYRETVKYFFLNELKKPIGERLTRLTEYLGVCLQRDKDPYRVSLEKMKAEEEARGMTGTWFFKAGGNDKRDTGYAPSHPFVSGSIAALLESGHEIGIHPSFHAHTDGAMFAREREALMQYSGPLKSCRQHYLRFAYPETWRIQVGQGITVDSTMGFPSREGFRNGACHPFQPYDLERDEPMDVWEVPMVVMDGTLNAYRGLNAEESLSRMLEILGIVKQHGGFVSILFHNVVYDPHDFPGWDKVYTATLDAIRDMDMAGRGMYDLLQEWLKTG